MGGIRYTSTRASDDSQTVTFEEALFSGYAPDGGIYVPTSVPQLSKAAIDAWSKLSFLDLVAEVMKVFISEDEIPHDAITGLAHAALSRFDIDEIVRLKQLPDGLNILELFHGPTLAFKDIALSVVAQLMGYFLKKKQRNVIVLVGTSGDTGSAAIESIRGLQQVDIIVLLPRGWCTKLQELQMTTVNEHNVHVYRVDGTSDDLDAPIKRCFNNPDFVKQHNLCSINSINWARVMVQIAHYFYAYFQMKPAPGKTLEIVIPTGALGNATSGVIATKLGLPVRLVCAVNTNDIVARTITGGDYRLVGEVVPTLAPAMDIQYPYNMERLLYFFSGGDSKMVARIQRSFEKTEKEELPSDILSKMKQVISTFVVKDDGIKAALQRCWKMNHYLLCPHTAVAANYHYSQPSTAGNPRVCIATASPGKFEEAVRAAGLEPATPPKLQKLYSLPTFYQDMEKGEDWDEILRQKIEAVTSSKQNA